MYHDLEVGLFLAAVTTVITIILLIILYFCCKRAVMRRDIEQGSDDSDEHTSLIKGEITTLRNNLENECAICLEKFNVKDIIRIMDCGHYYHQSCADVWLQCPHNGCPKCRAES